MAVLCPLDVAIRIKTHFSIINMERGRRKFIQTSEEKNIIIVNVSFCRYNLFNVGEWLLLKLHRKIALQSAQFNMRVSKIADIDVPFIFFFWSNF